MEFKYYLMYNDDIAAEGHDEVDIQEYMMSLL